MSIASPGEAIEDRRRHCYRRQLLWLAAPGPDRCGPAYYPAEAVLRKADILQAFGRWAEVEAVYRAGLDWLAGHGFRNDLANLQVRLASLLRDRGQYQESLTLFGSARAAFGQMGDDGGTERVLSNLAGLHHCQSDFGRARECLDQALAIARRQGNRKSICHVIGNLGIIHYEQGEAGRALDCYQEALRLGQEGGDAEAVMAATGNIGLIYQEQEDYPRAMEYSTRYLALAEHQGDKQTMSYALGNIGTVLLATDEYHQAKECFMQFYEIARTIGDTQGLIVAADSLAVVLMYQGEYRRSRQLLDQAMGLAEALGNREDIGRISGYYGEYFAKTEDPAKAEQGVDRAIALYQEIGAKYYLCDVLQQKAELLFSLKRLDEARQQNRQARELSDEMDRNQVRFKTELLEARLLGAEDPEAAAVRLGRMLERQQPDRHRAWINYYLFMYTGLSDHREEARGLLRDLHAKSGAVEYRDKLTELEQAGQGHPGQEE